MTSIYKVITKHTDQVLKDFISFTYKVRGGGTVVKLVLFAGCFLILAVAFKDVPVTAVICGIVGVLLLVFIFARRYIAFAKLSEADDNYKNQSEIHFTFGHSGFVVENKEEDVPRDGKYGEISGWYKDDRNYFIAMNNEELYVLPYTDFTQGDAVQFEQFITDKVKREVIPLKLPFRERMRRINEARKLTEAEHDRKAMELREKQKQKKNKK